MKEFDNQSKLEIFNTLTKQKEHFVPLNPGHVGLYVGDGWVIEAMGTKHGVKKTRLTERHWTHWLKIPYISYEPIEQQPTEPEEQQTTELIVLN